MSKTVIPCSYDRRLVTAGILHIGVGNFHRAHEEYYTNKLLSCNETQSGWGICGAMLLPSDERLYRALKQQDGVYTLTVCGRKGTDSALEIGSLVDLLWANEEPEAIIDRIADSATRIISMTVTEGGYNILKETGEFDFKNEAVAADISNPDSPRTLFGYIAAGLRRRRQNGNGGVTVLSCDNLQHNGATAKKAVLSFIGAQDADLAKWVEENVTFPNSMVDRITPATRPDDIERFNRRNGTDDMAPVYCEDFIQWVIEDDFAAGRPAWEAVGVEFTDDVAPYENMKLSLLNASHTLLSYPSFLAGYRKVDEAMRDSWIVKFVRDFMDIDITPYVEVPSGIDIEEYKTTLIERFGNTSVSDQISRLCFDGISKFPVYVNPNLSKMIRDGKDLSRVAFLIAAYRHYLKYRCDDNGETFDVAEPWITADDTAKIDSENPVDFLSLSAFGSLDLSSSPRFVDAYLEMVDRIKAHGVMSVMERL